MARAKKKQAFQYPLAKTTKGDRRGRHNRDSVKDLEIEDMRPILVKRCERLGWRPTQENIRKARSEHLECEAGIAIELVGFDVKRWGMVKDIRETYYRWYRSIGANPFARNSAIEILPDWAWQDADDQPRAALTPEQQDAKDEAAGRNMGRYDRLINENCGILACHVKDVIVYDKEAKAGFIKNLDIVINVLQNRKK